MDISLLQLVEAGFILQGTTLRAWCTNAHTTDTLDGHVTLETAHLALITGDHTLASLREQVVVASGAEHLRGFLSTPLRVPSSGGAVISSSSKVKMSLLEGAHLIQVVGPESTISLRIRPDDLEKLRTMPIDKGWGPLVLQSGVTIRYFKVTSNYHLNAQGLFIILSREVMHQILFSSGEGGPPVAQVAAFSVQHQRRAVALS